MHTGYIFLDFQYKNVTKQHGKIKAWGKKKKKPSSNVDHCVYLSTFPLEELQT